MNQIPISKLVRSKRKSIALEIKEDGALIVRAPFFMKDALIQSFVHQKRDWIDKVYQRVRQRFAQLRSKQFIEGEKFLYLGQEYLLHIAEDMFGKLLFEDKFILSQRYILKARSLFERWYREKAFAVFTKRCDLYAQQMGVKYESLKLTSPKYRWGSCHPKGHLCFNWRLVMAPIEILDYVVVHELAHLREPNHSSRFWAHVEKVFPNHRDAKKWLKENRFLLYF